MLLRRRPLPRGPEIRQDLEFLADPFEKFPWAPSALRIRSGLRGPCFRRQDPWLLEIRSDP